MEDNVNTTTEAALDATTENAGAADQPDAFMDGFDDEAATDTETADQPEQAEGESKDAQEQTADQPEQGAAEQDGKKDGATEQGGNQTAESKDAAAESQEGQDAPRWNVKYMDSQRTFTAKDITPELLQKGLDYDRVRSKYDEAKPIMEMFSGLAAKAGMSVSDFAKNVRAEAKKAEGLSDADARRAVELEDREAAVAAVEAREREAAQTREQKNANVQKDLADFARAFPDVYKQAGSDPSVIPESVWAEVDKGLTLTAAYSRHVAADAEAKIKAANERADTACKNAANAARSTGSQKSAGNDAKNTDNFLAGFEG